MPIVNALWNGATADWNTPADWSDGIVPDISNTDVTAGSGDCTSSIVSSASFAGGSMLLSDAKATFDNAGAITSGALTLDAGTLLVESSGNVELQDGATSNIAGNIACPAPQHLRQARPQRPRRAGLPAGDPRVP